MMCAVARHARSADERPPDSTLLMRGAQGKDVGVKYPDHLGATFKQVAEHAREHRNELEKIAKIVGISGSREFRYCLLSFLLLRSLRERVLPRAGWFHWIKIRFVLRSSKH